MDQITQLWEFQTEDMKADRIANQIRNSPLRKKMEEDRSAYEERRKQYSRIEEQIATLTDRNDAITDALNRCQEQLNNLQNRFDSIAESDLEAVRALMADVNRCLHTIKNYEDELRSIGRSVNECKKNANIIIPDVVRLRKEFEQLKAQYEKELPGLKASLDEQRDIAKSKREGISAELLAAYSEIKKHIMPPVAKLDDRGQCSGCHTALPSALKQRIRSASNEIVKCDNCGRMLIRM